MDARLLLIILIYTCICTMHVCFTLCGYWFNCITVKIVHDDKDQNNCTLYINSFFLSKYLDGFLMVWQRDWMLESRRVLKICLSCIWICSWWPSTRWGLSCMAICCSNYRNGVQHWEIRVEWRRHYPPWKANFETHPHRRLRVWRVLSSLYTISFTCHKILQDCRNQTMSARWYVFERDYVDRS